jgi:carbonic anhydrase
MRGLLLALLFLHPAFAFADLPTCPPNYGYSGYLVPTQWQFVKEWKCGTEPLQSPIDVARPWTPEHGDPITVSYEAMPLTVMNSGHDFRVIPTRPGSISVGGVIANLDQFHFHTPSEHTLGSRRPTAGEIHFVHTDPNTHEHYVIAVLLELSRKDNPAFQPIIDQLPIDLCASKESPTRLEPLLPEKIATYYRYVGSLTTPACDGDVTFFVLPTTMPISRKQRQALRRFGDNARPQQPRNGRPITLVVP